MEAQAGIPVPAARMEMPIFDAVLADIGDYQSIEQNLSTFSAHVTNINFISRTATANSLVLLDELGSATDPEEGAALAVAIAEQFLRTGCFTVISTHHTSLKVFGANSPGVVNASRTLRRVKTSRSRVPLLLISIACCASCGSETSIASMPMAQNASGTVTINATARLRAPRIARRQSARSRRA